MFTVKCFKGSVYQQVCEREDDADLFLCVPPDQSAAAAAAGFGKRERQNIDPGKH